MTTTIDYQFNSGDFTYTLGTADLATLNVALTTVEGDPTVAGAGSLIYTTLLNIIAHPGTGTTGTLDPNVLQWLKGAIGVNADSSAPGTFIRAFTSDIYDIRYGTEPTSTQLNTASNEIAINLALSIKNNGGLLPDIEGLGAIDAGFGAAANLFDTSPDPSTGVYSPWAGTLLFPST